MSIIYCNYQLNESENIYESIYIYIGISYAFILFVVLITLLAWFSYCSNWFLKQLCSAVLPKFGCNLIIPSGNLATKMSCFLHTSFGYLIYLVRDTERMTFIVNVGTPLRMFHDLQVWWIIRKSGKLHKSVENDSQLIPRNI